MVFRRTVPVALVALICFFVIATASNAHSRKHHDNWYHLTDGQKSRHLAKTKEARWEVRRNDFHKALKFSAWYWRVSYDWLHNCAHAEGGHGPRMIWNSGGSSAYGVFQYMPGTYLGFASKAFRAGKAKGLKLRWSQFYDKKYPNGRPDTMFGQAFASAWAFKNGLDHHWVASPC